jgi:Sec-independent protein secretion pathway component TatC
MTSATIRPTSSPGGYPSERHGRGFMAFASILLFVIGSFNVIYGVAAIGGSNVFVAGAHYVLGDLRTWGWATLVLGVLQLLAAFGVLAGNQLARWFAVAVIGLNAIGQMFATPGYPVWSLTIIAMDVVALYALCAHGSRQNMTA